MIEYLKGKGGTKLRSIVILPDSITKRNFENELMNEKITKPLDVYTLEGIGRTILNPAMPDEIEVLERVFVRNMAFEIIKGTTEGPLLFFKSIVMETRESQEMFFSEFEEYLRCTDIGRLHSELEEVVKKMENQFAREISLKSIEGFRVLEDELRKRLDHLDCMHGDVKGSESWKKTYMSKYHLQSAAMDKIKDTVETFKDVDSVCVSKFTVFDANALRFLITLHDELAKRMENFEMRIYQGLGTFSRLKNRLDIIGISYSIEDKSIDPSKERERSWLCLAKGEDYAEGECELVAVPERRREIEEVARRIYKLLTIEKVHPSEILIVARDCGRYLELVKEIFPYYGIPVYVQTRRPYAHLAAYRFLKCTFDLLSSIEKKEKLVWYMLTDPLRLGFCLPEKSNWRWPVSAHDFIYLEEELSSAWGRERDRIDGERDIDEWLGYIRNNLKLDRPRDMMIEFLEWARKTGCESPKDVDFICKIIGELLNAFSENNFAWVHKTKIPLLEKKERYDISRLHPTYFSNKIRKERDSVKDYIEKILKESGCKLDWSLSARALGELFGLKTYGIQHDDLCAVRMTDIGTSSFIESKYLFMLGMKTEEFPRAFPDCSFLHIELRKELENFDLDVKTKGDRGYLYLRNPSNDYDSEVDLFGFPLEGAKGKIYFLMPYLDEKGHVSDWSSFLEPLLKRVKETRKLPEEWLFDIKGLEELKIVPPRERMRLFCAYSMRSYLPDKFPISKEELQRLGKLIDYDVYNNRIKPRIDRYLEPPRKIEVKGDEKCFEKLKLEEIAGSPYRAHELDMHAYCPFKFYFYQYLYARYGDDIERDDFPYYSKRAHWRFGRLPRRLSYIHPTKETLEKFKKVLISWKDRQNKLSNISYDDLQKELEQLVGDYESKRMQNEFLFEKRLVEREVIDGKVRAWNWVDGGEKIEIDKTKKYEVIVPAHRLDMVGSSKMMGKIVMIYLNFSGQISKVQYSAWKPSSRACYACDPLLEYRLPIILKYYKMKNEGKDVADIVGAIYDEFYSGKRMGYYKEGALSLHKGSEGYEEELLVTKYKNKNSKYDYHYNTKKQLYSDKEWEMMFENFDKALLERVDKMAPKVGKQGSMQTNVSVVTYESTPSEERCEKCVYRELCQIPRVDGLGC